MTRDGTSRVSLAAEGLAVAGLAALGAGAYWILGWPGIAILAGALLLRLAGLLSERTR